MDAVIERLESLRDSSIYLRGTLRYCHPINGCGRVSAFLIVPPSLLYRIHSGEPNHTPLFSFDFGVHYGTIN